MTSRDNSPTIIIPTWPTADVGNSGTPVIGLLAHVEGALGLVPRHSTNEIPELLPVHGCKYRLLDSSDLSVYP